jgi:hypothetical protein
VNTLLLQLPALDLELGNVALLGFVEKGFFFFLQKKCPFEPFPKPFEPFM